MLIVSRRGNLAFALAAILALCETSRADEPTKPTSPASETNPAQPAAGHSIHGEAFDDGPRSHAVLLPDQGKVDFPSSSPNAECRRFIEQGVAQLHTFYYFEAERSFRQAAKLDPDCAMAYWGMAMSNVNNAKRAKAFVKEARAAQKKRQVSRREQLYLDSIEALYREGKTTKQQKADHLLGLEAIVQEFPADLDARAWLAMVTWQNAATDGIGSRQAVDTLIESILDKEPLHPGANHYRIHLWDHVKAARAERAAAVYAKAATGIAHAWHMPGHTYTELRRYNDAAYQQEGSARVDHAAMFRDRIMPCEIHNYTHNNQWLATSLSNVGRARDAIYVARNLVEQPRDPNKNGPNNGGSSQRSGRARWTEVLKRYELWDEAIQAIESEALDYGTSSQEKVMKHHTLGLAYAGKGDAAKLAEQIKALEALKTPPRRPETKPAEAASKPNAQAKPEAQAKPDAQVKPDAKAKPEATVKPDAQVKPEAPVKPEAQAKPPVEVAAKDAPKPKDAAGEAPKPKAETSPSAAKPDAQTPAKPAEAAKPASPPAARPSNGPQPGASSPAIAELRVLELLLRGDKKAAIESIAKTPSIRDDVAARYYLAAGDNAKAEAAARKAVDSQPDQFPPLAQLVEVLHRVGKTEEARKIMRKAEAIGRDADRDTPIMIRLAKITEEWKTKDGWRLEPETIDADVTPLYRHDFDQLGPLGWMPNPAIDFRLVDTEGKPYVLSEHKGRNVVVLFFLGNKCAHCLQQLQVFGKEIEALKALGTDLVAVSTDTAEVAKQLKNNEEGVKFPMPILADPNLDVFKKYRSFDEFEDTPIHGTFLIDAKGFVRFQKLSAEPFLDIEFIKTEAARVNRINR